MDISPLSEQSHNTRSVPSLANVPLPISHADCDSYELRFSLRKPSMREWLHISTWLPVWVISISSAAKWLLVTKQTLCRLCGTQHCKANNNWEEGKRVRELDWQQWTPEENHTDDSCMGVHFTHSSVQLWEVWDSNLHQVSNMANVPTDGSPTDASTLPPVDQQWLSHPLSSSTHEKQTHFEHVSIK